jgi:hypothetical protein
MLRLNMAVTGPTGLDMQPLEEASRLGVIGGDIQGFPNGRRLADDVVDIELLALEGIYDVSAVPADRQAAFDALQSGDGVDVNDEEFSEAFPYVAAPNTEAVNQGGGSADGAVAAPVGTGGGTSGGGTLVPAVTGAAAMVLLTAGGLSLLRDRLPVRGRRAAQA